MMKTFNVTILLLLSTFHQVVFSKDLRGGNDQNKLENAEGVEKQAHEVDLDLSTKVEGLKLDTSSKSMVPTRCSLRCHKIKDVAYRVDGVCTCLSPCADVCGAIMLRCTGHMWRSAGHYTKKLSDWVIAENTKCFEIEKRQGSTLSSFFLRTTCKCPERDYAISEACDPQAQANLKNCIRGEITANHEINFGSLENVKIGHVESIGSSNDIDFQGDVRNSRFCHLKAGEDIEFGGGECPIQFYESSVRRMTIGQDLQFERGTWIGPDNIFGSVVIADDFQFNNDSGHTRDTEIWDNTWKTIDAGGRCNYNDGIPESSISVSGNVCVDFDVNNDSDCDPTVFGGFSCA